MTTAATYLLGDTTVVETRSGEVQITDFSFARCIIALEELTALLETAELPKTVGSLGLVTADKGLFESLLESIPRLIRDGQAGVFRLIGVIITPDEQIAEWHKAGTWKTEVHDVGLTFAYTNSLPVVYNVFRAGLKHLANDPQFEIELPNVFKAAVDWIWTTLTGTTPELRTSGL